MNNRIHRIKYLKLLELLRSESNEENPLKSTYIIQQLANIGISIDRRTLYDDIKVLNSYGYEVLCKRSRQNEYYVVDRYFDTAELRILIDAVHATSFISSSKTMQLQDKIASLAGKPNKNRLMRNNIGTCSHKHSNDHVYYSVNEIEEAIAKNKKITFKYFDLNIGAKRNYRKSNKLYEVNPITTMINNNHYYLLCYHDKYKTIASYRIDRMDNVNPCNACRTPSQLLTDFDINEYRKQQFGMFSGEIKNITLQFDKSLINVIYDKFGENTVIKKVTDQLFRTEVKVIESAQFFGEIAGLGEKIKILSPQCTVQNFINHLNLTKDIY